MKTSISPLVSRAAILTGLFLGAFAISAIAWSSPVSAPPTCNAGDPGCDAPINTSASTQTKIGPLVVSNSSLNTGTGLLVPWGNVVIGTGANTSVPTQYGLYVTGKPMKAAGGFVMETRTADPAVADMKTGRMWMIVSSPITD